MRQKIKVYQVQIVRRFDELHNPIPWHLRKFKVVCIGTVITPKSKRILMNEDIWDLFNWTCWNWGKIGRQNAWIYGIRNGIRRDGFRMFPNRNAQGFCNSDIFFFMDGVWHAAAHVGFQSFSSRDEAIEFCKENIRH